MNMNECEEVGHDEYTEKTCPQCGTDFCYVCAAGTNIYQGGACHPDICYAQTVGVTITPIPRVMSNSRGT